MMDDLVKWLGEQLDEDERVAQAADGPHWEAGDKVGEGGLYNQDDGWALTWFELGWTNPPGEGHLPAFPNHERHAMENSIHAARWDPARVLAEVEAKRAVLSLYQAHEESVALVLAAGLSPAHADERRNAVRAAVRALTLPYRDRPGWQPEWAPDVEQVR